MPRCTPTGSSSRWAACPAPTARNGWTGGLAAERLAAAGVLLPGSVAGPGGAPARDDPDAVLIRVLGRFEVSVAARPVPPPAWQSRKARDLLRVLVSRRGRAVPRSELSELLWPDDDPARTGHRLSVLLSIVRTVLDPDRQAGTDRYVIAEQASVALDLTRVRVDIEEFLAEVSHGMRLRDRGSSVAARALLAAAEARYAGEAFEDEPYESWSAPLQEEARAAYLRTLRALAQLSREAAEPEQAVRCLLRILEKDPYDEESHRALVETLVEGGRHGEARRAFSRDAAAMREIGVPPPTVRMLEPRRGAPARLPSTGRP